MNDKKIALIELDHSTFNLTDEYGKFNDKNLNLFYFFLKF